MDMRGTNPFVVIESGASAADGTRLTVTVKRIGPLSEYRVYLFLASFIMIVEAVEGALNAIESLTAEKYGWAFFAAFGTFGVLLIARACWIVARRA